MNVRAYLLTAIAVIIAFYCVFAGTTWVLTDRDTEHAVVEINSASGVSEILYSVNRKSCVGADEMVLDSVFGECVTDNNYHYTFKDKNDKLFVRMHCEQCGYHEEETFFANSTIAKLFACDCMNEWENGFFLTKNLREYFALTANYEERDWGRQVE